MEGDKVNTNCVATDTQSNRSTKNTTNRATKNTPVSSGTGVNVPSKNNNDSYSGGSNIDTLAPPYIVINDGDKNLMNNGDTNSESLTTDTSQSTIMNRWDTLLFSPLQIIS